MKIATSIVAIALTAAAVGCAKNEPQAQGAQYAPSGAQGQPYAANCPLSQLTDVHASVADVHDGVAITFTVPESELSYLRDDVKAMKDANDDRGDAFAACPCAAAGMTQPYGSTENMPSGNQSSNGPNASTSGQSGQTAMQPGQTGMTGMRVAAKASVDDIPTGSVLKLTTKDSSQVQMLRDQAHSEVQALRHSCFGTNMNNP